jgi:hypothetical protein
MASFEIGFLKGKPFWISDPEVHKAEYARTKMQCCFNHAIGLPRKDGKEMPIFDYELKIFDALQSYKRIWIKKATGLGITEFMLRYMTWSCVKDNKLQNSQICIVTGPSILRAIDLIKRMKNLFQNRLLFNTKETVLEINGVRIEAFPSHHLDTMRGLPNVSFIFLDEADFFPASQQEEARAVSERYILKSNPYIVMVSTPNSPRGLFQQIEEEPTEEQILLQNLKDRRPCLYHRLFFDYTVGEGKIYAAEQIEDAMNSDSWLREYCLQYGYGTGTVFSTASTRLIRELGEKYRSDYLKVNPTTLKSMAIDPGFGGQSGSAIVISELMYMHDGIIRIIYARRKMSLDLGEIMDWTMDLRQYYDPNKIYVDGWHSGFIRSLKKKVGERWRDEDIVMFKQRAKKYRRPLESYMSIIPVTFSNNSRDILSHTRDIIENEKALAVDAEEFKNLYLDIVSARQEDGKLLKEGQDSKDLIDALMMNLLYYCSATNESQFSTDIDSF